MENLQILNLHKSKLLDLYSIPNFQTILQMKALVLAIALVLYKLEARNFENAIEEINQKEKLALQKNIYNNVQSQLTETFARNQISYKPPNSANQYYPRQQNTDNIQMAADRSYTPSYFVQSQPKVLSDPIPVAQQYYMKSQNPPIVQEVLPKQNFYAQPSNSNYINGMDNIVDGERNVLSGVNNDLMGYYNTAVGDSNLIKGSANLVNANKAVVHGHLNRVMEVPIYMNELY